MGKIYESSKEGSLEAVCELWQDLDRVRGNKIMPLSECRSIYRDKTKDYLDDLNAELFQDYEKELAATKQKPSAKSSPKKGRGFSKSSLFALTSEQKVALPVAGVLVAIVAFFLGRKSAPT